MLIDKVLMHVGPAGRVLERAFGSLRPGGLVGMVEWLPVFALSLPNDMVGDYNALFQSMLYDWNVASHLKGHALRAGFQDVEVGSFLVTADSLNDNAFWRDFVPAQLSIAAHQGLLFEARSSQIAAAFQEAERSGAFFGAFLVRAGTARRPA